MVDLNRLQPLIVPAAYVQLNGWDLPHSPLPNLAFVVTWVEFEEGLTYLTREEFEELEATAPGWPQRALDNVRQTQWFHRQHKHGQAGELDWIAFLNDDDTSSSSKVLLQWELSRIFPEGYLVGIPDRACALVVSAHCTGDALTQVRELMAQMYATATTPMSHELYPSSDFQVSDAWAAPIADDPTPGAILALFEK
ncbi:hypothetical protein [Hymenobacter persicinus]|uniref:Uncharacterized protein n=1 Tax=Hymenobacter persicinus TaxID=2025506 RepID=A0A4Q5LFQ2_9BACT|nr:hypothetical protein [Hymenobacter persicinus]RYU81827.1 hypothetical protein EWM57_05455 [Hymenobacter persicinus]